MEQGNINYIMGIVMMGILEKESPKAEEDMIGHVVPLTLASLKKD